MSTLETVVQWPLNDKASGLARPFLKWVGGKGQLLDQFRPLLPQRFGRYFEPFVGGAALFFALNPDQSALTDINAELINCYLAVRDNVEALISSLANHKYDKDHYYLVREIDPATLSTADRAARTIFLNRAGFNGLYRVNHGGRFNVPFGRYTNPVICNAKNLRACSIALRRTELTVRDFSSVVDYAKSGDFVYFDPPYAPVSATSSFTSYIPGGFGWKDQERLAAAFRALDNKGVYVMLSNSDVDEVRKLYRGYEIDGVTATRNINSKGSSRGRIGEIVVRNSNSWRAL